MKLLNPAAWKTMDRELRAKKLSAATGGFVGRVLLYVFLIGVSFVLLYPILYMLSMAFRPLDQMYDPNVEWIPTSFTLSNVQLIWTRMKYPVLLKNSLILCLGSTLLQTAACALTGYGFARFRFKEKGLWMALLFLTIVLPPEAVSVANYLELKDFSVLGIVPLAEKLADLRITINLLDTAAVYFLPALFGAGMRSGLFILIFRQFFSGLPKELEASAYVDGCGALKTFVRIILPNTKPAVVVVALLSFVWYWNDTYYGFMYLDDLQTVSMRLSQIVTDMTQIFPNFYGDPNQATPLVQAGALMSIGPMLIIYMLCQKVFVESVERSGIVG